MIRGIIKRTKIYFDSFIPIESNKDSFNIYRDKVDTIINEFSIYININIISYFALL